MTRENINEYIHHFAVFSGPKYAGSLILRLHYQHQSFMAANRFTTKILRDRPRCQTLAVQGWNQNQLTGELTMELFFPKRSAAATLQSASQDLTAASALRADAIFWRRFTAGEIQDFSRRTGDKNPLHLAGRPMVQGLFILQQLFFSFARPEELHLSFHAPLYAGEAVYLQEKTLTKRDWKTCCGRQQPKANTKYSGYQGYTATGRLLFTCLCQCQKGDGLDEGH